MTPVTPVAPVVPVVPVAPVSAARRRSTDCFPDGRPRNRVRAACSDLLLLFVPLGFVAAALNWHPLLVCAANVLALVPLSAAVADASCNLGRVCVWGPLVGGLVDATFGNAVQVLVLTTVWHGEAGLAQSMVLGTVISDVLLALGACLIASVARHETQPLFRRARARSVSSLVVITGVALALPTALFASFPGSVGVRDRVLAFSRTSAPVLVAVYAVSVYFGLRTHKKGADNDRELPVNQPPFRPRHHGSRSKSRGSDMERKNRRFMNTTQLGQSPTSIVREVTILVAGAASVGWCAHLVLDSLDTAVPSLHVTKTFLATIVLPVASSAPACAAAATAVARNQCIDCAVDMVVRNFLRTALFVLPSAVLAGWVLGEEMLLCFEATQACVLLLAVLVAGRVLRARSYNHLHGILLVSVYAIIVLLCVLKGNRRGPDFD